MFVCIAFHGMGFGLSFAIPTLASDPSTGTFIFLVLSAPSGIGKGWDGSWVKPHRAVFGDALHVDQMALLRSLSEVFCVWLVGWFFFLAKRCTFLSITSGPHFLSLWRNIIQLSLHHGLLYINLTLMTYLRVEFMFRRKRIESYILGSKQKMEDCCSAQAQIECSI